MFGDRNGDYFKGKLGSGRTNLTATAYSENNMNGDVVAEFGISFVVIQPPNGKFVMVDAETNQDLTTLVDGETLALSDYPDVNFFNIRAEFRDSESVESVYFEYDAGDNRTENVPPYALFGDNGGDYRGGMLPEGDINIKAKAYSKNNKKGEMVAEMAIAFEVTEEAANTRSLPVNEQTPAPLAIETTVFPNPVVDQVNVQFNNVLAGTVKFILSDLSGKTILVSQKRMDKGNHQITFDLSDGIENGIYLLKMESPGRDAQSFRLVKN